MTKPGPLPGSPRPTITDAPAINNARINLRADPTTTPSIDPALCGFVDGTSATYCEESSTCKFNTDLYAVGCCSNDKCNWRTRCCGFVATPSATFTVGTDLIVNTCGDDIFSQSSRIASWYVSSPTPHIIMDSHLTPKPLIYSLPAHPYCALHRWENGYTRYMCASVPFLSTRSILFTSKGETTAAPGLPRLTGSNGPPPTLVASATSTSSTAANPTIQAASSETSKPSAGVIAGSVVGGAAAGALITLLVVFLTFYFRKRKTAVPEGQYPNVTAVQTPMYNGMGSPGYPAGTMTGDMMAFSSDRASTMVPVGTSYYTPVGSPSPGLKDGYHHEVPPAEVLGSPGLHELSGSVREPDQGQRGHNGGGNA